MVRKGGVYVPTGLESPAGAKIRKPVNYVYPQSFID